MLKTKTKLVLSIDGPTIDGNKVSGYFSDSDNEIVVNYEPGWEETLVHEINHYFQFIEKSKYWTNLEYLGSNCISLMWEWINGDIELTKSELNIVFSRVRDLEHDCEKRTVRMIKKYKLSIDIEKYICEANIYILFYNLAKSNRKWFPEDVGPNAMFDVFPLVPKTIYGSRTLQSMSKKLIVKMGHYLK